MFLGHKMLFSFQKQYFDKLPLVISDVGNQGFRKRTHFFNGVEVKCKKHCPSISDTNSGTPYTNK